LEPNNAHLILIYYFHYESYKDARTKSINLPEPQFYILAKRYQDFQEGFEMKSMLEAI
jgi:hypothetical protein